MYFTLKVPVCKSRKHRASFEEYVLLTANSVWVDEADGDEVVLGVERAPVGDSEWLVRDGVPNGAPYVNDTDASLEKAVGVLAEVTMHASDAGVEGLVDVHAFLMMLVSIGTIKHRGVYSQQDRGAIARASGWCLAYG